MEKWSEQRIEAYKNYVKADIEVIGEYENRMRSLQKELQELTESRERKIEEVEKQMTQLYYQGWEMRRSEWVQVENPQ